MDVSLTSLLRKTDRASGCPQTIVRLRVPRCGNIRVQSGRSVSRVSGCFLAAEQRRVPTYIYFGMRSNFSRVPSRCASVRCATRASSSSSPGDSRWLIGPGEMHSRIGVEAASGCPSIDRRTINRRNRIGSRVRPTPRRFLLARTRARSL